MLYILLRLIEMHSMGCVFLVYVKVIVYHSIQFLDVSLLCKILSLP